MEKQRGGILKSRIVFILNLFLFCNRMEERQKQEGLQLCFLTLSYLGLEETPGFCVIGCLQGRPTWKAPRGV
jgi:hypothetical protein